MPQIKGAVLILVLNLLTIGCIVSNGQILTPEKGIYDFEIILSTDDFPLYLNSENPIGRGSFNITITNTGLIPDEYNIDASCSIGWPMVLSPQSIPVGTGNWPVPPGSSFNLTATVVVPQVPRSGSICEICVIVQSLNSPQQISKQKNATLGIHSPLLSVHYISTSLANPVRGQETTITATLMNDGDFYEPKANISFFIDGRSLDLNNTVGRMEPGESKDITVKWIALDGSHSIEARTEHWFADDENSSQTVQVKISSKPPMEKTAAALLFIIIVTISLVISKMKYTKRKKNK